jgi:hypothetical protein
MEEGVAVFNVSWKDEDGAAVTPSVANWTLTDAYGNVVNSRSGVSIGSLSTANDIVLSGDDLVFSGVGLTGSERQLKVTYTYASDLGTLTQNHGVRFSITDLAVVT